MAGFFFDKNKMRSNVINRILIYMLIIICIILSISTVGLGLYAYSVTKIMVNVVTVHNKFISALAGALETYVVNDNALDVLGKKATFDHIMLSAGEIGAYWKQFPAGVTTLLKSIRDWTERQIVISRHLGVKK